MERRTMGCGRARPTTIGSALVAALGLASGAARAAPVPDFSGFWQHSVAGIEFIPPVHGPGPVTDVARRGGCPAMGDFDSHAMQRSPLCGPRPRGIPYIGDTDNPILKPWAKAVIEKANAAWRAGDSPYSPSARCLPSGVPRILQVQSPVQILQSPKEIVILYQRDHQVRRIHLDQPHLKNPAPSWYGDSVGHYEGDTLVVDTIGLKANTTLDYYSTPHTAALHVVERYRVVHDGKGLEVRFTVEDPGAFTTAWSATHLYRRVTAPQVIGEEICAENNRGVPTPTDTTPDF